MIRLQQDRIDVQEVMASVASDAAGAIDLFLGTTRNHEAGRSVLQLAYEAYDEMALKEMERIVGEAKSRWPVERIALVHRLGVVPVGEPSVAIAVSSAHRAEAFEACRYVIDTLKRTVPIWKKETFSDGTSEWSNHPESLMSGASLRK